MNELDEILLHIDNLKQCVILKEDILLYINNCCCNAVKYMYGKNEDDNVYPSYIILYLHNNIYYVLVGGYYKYVDYDGRFTTLFDKVPKTLFLNEYKTLADAPTTSSRSSLNSACNFIITTYTYMFSIYMYKFNTEDIEDINNIITDSQFYHKIINKRQITSDAGGTPIFYYEYNYLNNIHIYSDIILDVLLNEYHLM